MEKTIVVHIEYVFDKEVMINATKIFHSEKEFEDARQEAIDNWKEVQGDNADVQCYGEVLETGRCLEMRTYFSDEYETWDVIAYEGPTEDCLEHKEDKEKSMRNSEEDAVDDIHQEFDPMLSKLLIIF